MFRNALLYSPSDSGRAAYRKTRCCISADERAYLQAYVRELFSNAA